MTQQPQPSKTRSEFPFFGGEKTLVVTAPDDPEAKHSRRFDEPIWSTVRDVLYQTVSSSEVDRRHFEIEAWVAQVHAAYHARVGTTPD